MRKSFTFYAVIWAICLAVFNVLAFVVPAIPEFPKFTTSFWLGYGFVTAAFIAQLAIVLLIVRQYKKDSVEKVFLRIPMLRWSFISLISCATVGGIVMAFSSIPSWVAIIVCVLTTAFCAIAVLTAKMAVTEVEQVGKDISNKTEFMKTLALETNILQNSAKNAEAQALTQKVWNAVYYSDSVSSPTLEKIEMDLLQQFQQFAKAISANDMSEASIAGENFLRLLKTRNAMCKALKK